MNDLLTEQEIRLVSELGRCGGLFREVIGKGRQSANDRDEVSRHIINMQNMVLANAAARAYPTKYRLLGKDIKQR